MRASVLSIPLAIPLATLLATALFLASGAAVSAHANGFTLESTVGDKYVIDIGVDAPVVYAGESRWLDFWLLDAATKKPTEYDSVWVRITDTNGILFSSLLQPSEFGGAAMTYVFPRPQDYNLKVQYMTAAGDVLADHTFELAVAEDPLAERDDGVAHWLTLAGVSAASFALGAALMYALPKKRKTSGA